MDDEARARIAKTDIGEISVNSENPKQEKNQVSANLTKNSLNDLTELDYFN